PCDRQAVSLAGRRSRRTWGGNGPDPRRAVRFHARTLLSERPPFRNDPPDPMHELFLETIGHLGPWAMAYAAVVVFLGGVLRGFTGFGFALAVVPTLSLILPPVEIVPAIAAIGIPAGLFLVGRIARTADWRSIR